MGTAVTTARPRFVPAGRYDRVFYSGMALLMALTVFGGFSRTYYAKLAGDAPLLTQSGSPFTTVLHIHAALFTSWVLLFVVQTALVAQHRVALHRKLGLLGAGLAAAMIVVGTATAIGAAARGASPPGMEPLKFLVIPLADMVLFAGFVSLAIAQRRNKEAHKRLMLLAYMSIIIAAVARFPGVMEVGPPAFMTATVLFVLLAVAYDLVSRRRVHRVYLIGGLALIASGPLRGMIANTGAWRAFAEAVTR